MAIPTLPQAKNVPTPEAVLAYCEAGYTNAQAAAHWGVSDRYIRKLKSKARSDSESSQFGTNGGTSAHHQRTSQPLPEAPQLLATGALAPVAPFQPSSLPASLYATVAPHEVARDGVLWKCPICGELMPPLPGTTGAMWAAEGCYLHQARPPFQVAKAEQRVGTVPLQVNDQEEQFRPLEHEDPAPSLVVPARNTDHQGIDMSGTGPGEVKSVKFTDLSFAPSQPVERVVVRERIVERVVYRVPIERPSSPVVAWAREHMPPVQLVVAFLVAALLIGIASLG